jgi:hypothetical protein
MAPMGRWRLRHLPLMKYVDRSRVQNLPDPGPLWERNSESVATEPRIVTCLERRRGEEG